MEKFVGWGRSEISLGHRAGSEEGGAGREEVGGVVELVGEIVTAAVRQASADRVLSSVSLVSSVNSVSLSARLVVLRD